MRESEGLCASVKRKTGMRFSFRVLLANFVWLVSFVWGGGKNIDAMRCAYN